MFCEICYFQGRIYKAKIEGVNEEVYICDECDALWYGPYIPNIASNSRPATNLTDFLAQRGLKYMETPITDLGKNWDKTVLGDDTLVFCPHCDVRGILYEIESHTLNAIFYFCDNCNAMWIPGETIDKKKNITLWDFLHAQQLDYSKANFGHINLLHKVNS